MNLDITPAIIFFFVYYMYTPRTGAHLVGLPPRQLRVPAVTAPDRGSSGDPAEIQRRSSGSPIRSAPGYGAGVLHVLHPYITRDPPSTLSQTPPTRHRMRNTVFTGEQAVLTICTATSHTPQTARTYTVYKVMINGEIFFYIKLFRATMSSPFTPQSVMLTQPPKSRCRRLESVASNCTPSSVILSQPYKSRCCRWVSTVPSSSSSSEHDGRPVSAHPPRPQRPTSRRRDGP
jgi:hypothetical protein